MNASVEAGGNVLSLLDVENFSQTSKELSSKPLEVAWRSISSYATDEFYNKQDNEG